MPPQPLLGPWALAPVLLALGPAQPEAGAGSSADGAGASGPSAGSCGHLCGSSRRGRGLTFHDLDTRSHSWPSREGLQQEEPCELRGRGDGGTGSEPQRLLVSSEDQGTRGRARGPGLRPTCPVHSCFRQVCSERKTGKQRNSGWRGWGAAGGMFWQDKVRRLPAGREQC